MRGYTCQPASIVACASSSLGPVLAKVVYLSLPQACVRACACGWLVVGVCLWLVACMDAWMVGGVWCAHDIKNAS